MKFFGFKNMTISLQIKLLLYPLAIVLPVLSTVLLIRLISQLNDQFTLFYTDTLINSSIAQTTLIGIYEQAYITSVIQSKISYIKKYRQLNKLVLGLNAEDPPIKCQPAISHIFYYDQPSDYTRGCYMSPRSELSEEGLNLLTLQGAMDDIVPIMAEKDFLYIYSGFEIDEIIYYYPGEYTSDPNYSPLVREWYYKAKDNQEKFVISEPYFDSTTKKVIITLSAAINNSKGSFIGVAGCDVTLMTLSTLISKFRVFDTGFMLLISLGGMILNSPEVWNIEISSPERVYGDLVGISQETWEEIINGSDGEEWEYSRNETDYILMKFRIMPFDDNETSHYLLVFINKSEILVLESEYKGEYNDSYKSFIGICICFCICIFIAFTLSLFVYLVYLRRAFNIIKRWFKDIVCNVLDPDIDVELYDSSELKKKHYEWIVNIIKKKIKYFHERKEFFYHYNWGSTRPADYFFYSVWINKLYPYNKFSDVSFKWKEKFLKLGK